MTNLKPVNVGMNNFCGPAVLSILTGKSTDDCVRAIRSVYRDYDGREVPYPSLLQAANRLGFDTPSASIATSLYGTIVRLAKEDGIYIILVPHHVITIEVIDKTAYFCDNHTKEPIPAASSARLGQRVLAANKVVERPKPPEPPKPKLIRSVYSVDINQMTKVIYINKTNEYDNTDYNVMHCLGSISYGDEAEFKEIRRAIAETFGNVIQS